jgi:polysaccharide chain length determinant protein (PEP-CTERM system associated)
MNSVLEQLLYEIRGTWRFHRLALAVAWGLCLIGWTAVFFVPNTFEATARVFVDPRTTLNQVTQGITVESNVDTQIQRVRQALLGGPELREVAHETGLDAHAVTPQARQGLIGSLRNRITITGTSTRENPGVYSITYRDSDRERSVRVVERLLTVFMQSTLGGKRAGSAQAQHFLLGQIKEYEHRLAGAEDSLAAFKRQNVGLMPGTQGDYFTRLQAEMEATSKARAALQIAERRRNEIERQLRGEQPFTSAAPAASAPGAAGAVREPDIVRRIRETQVHLDDLLLRFTDKHPDVISLRETLKELEARQREQIEAVRRGDPDAAAQLGMNANPVYQSIQLQLNQTDVEIAALRGEIADHDGKIANLRRMVNTAPEIEAQFARLNRDYDVTRTAYQALVERLNRTRLSDEADATGGLHFEVIDPPSASFKPIAPRRSLMIGAVLLIGLAAGGGVAYLIHQFRPVFNTTRELCGMTGLPVLGVVSMTWLERHRARARREFVVFAGLVAVLCGLAALVYAAQDSAMRLLQHVAA